MWTVQDNKGPIVATITNNALHNKNRITTTTRTEIIQTEILTTTPLKITQKETLTIAHQEILVIQEVHTLGRAEAPIKVLDLILAQAEVLTEVLDHSLEDHQAEVLEDHQAVVVLAVVKHRQYLKNI